jgi:hypothetical protein
MTEAAGGSGSGRIDDEMFAEELQIRKQTFREIMRQLEFSPKLFRERSPKTSNILTNTLAWWRPIPNEPLPLEYIREYRTTPTTCALALYMFENVFQPAMEKYAPLRREGDFDLAFKNVVVQAFFDLKLLYIKSRFKCVQKLQDMYRTYEFPEILAFRRLPLRKSTPQTSLRTGIFSKSARCKTVEDSRSSFADIGFHLVREKQELVVPTYATTTPYEKIVALQKVFDEDSAISEFLRTNRDFRGAVLDMVLQDTVSHQICPLVFLQEGFDPIIVIVNSWHFDAVDVNLFSSLTPAKKHFKVHVFPNDAIPENDASFRNLQEKDVGKGQCQDWSVILAYKFAKAFTYADLLPARKGGAAAGGVEDYSSLYTKVTLFYKLLNEENDLIQFQRDVGLLGGEIQCSVQ